MLPPENRPALPRPVTALPIMNVDEDGAEALTIEPTAKMMKDVRNIAFVG